MTDRLSYFYSREASAEQKAALTGPISRLFFANKDEIVHKWLHYLPIYERLFAPWVGKPVRFLEIGVSKGGSLRLWRSYFGPGAQITGIDIDPACAQLDGKEGNVRIGSQADPDFLRAVVAEIGGVDIVLDDGSHFGEHQQVSFDVLFPLVSEGGLYVIEDLHTAYWPGWDGGLRRPGTGIEMLKGGMHEHYFIHGRNNSEAIPEIESVQFFDSIAAIEKRVQQPRCHVMVPDPFG